MYCHGVTAPQGREQKATGGSALSFSSFFPLSVFYLVFGGLVLLRLSSLTSFESCTEDTSHTHARTYSIYTVQTFD